jgi:hypothetical protein
VLAEWQSSFPISFVVAVGGEAAVAPAAFAGVLLRALGLAAEQC